MTSQQLVVELVALRGLSTEVAPPPFEPAYQARHATTHLTPRLRVRGLAARRGDR